MTRLDALSIDRIGIAVRDLDDAIAAYEQQYRLTVESRHFIAAQGVEEANLRLGDGYVHYAAGGRHERGPVPRPAR